VQYLGFIQDREIGLLDVQYLNHFIMMNFFFRHSFSLFSHTPLFFATFCFPVPISTLKQHNTTLILSDGLYGFRVKNAHRKKISGEKKGGGGGMLK
jgi:hypothetical protein